MTNKVRYLGINYLNYHIVLVRVCKCVYVSIFGKTFRTTVASQNSDDVILIIFIQKLFPTSFTLGMTPDPLIIMARKLHIIELLRAKSFRQGVF